MNNTELMNVILEYPILKNIPEKYIEFLDYIFDYYAIFEDIDPFGISSNNSFIVGEYTYKVKYYELINTDIIVPDEISEVFYYHLAYGSYSNLVTIVNKDYKIFDNFENFILYLSNTQDIYYELGIFSSYHSALFFVKINRIKTPKKVINMEQ